MLVLALQELGQAAADKAATAQRRWSRLQQESDAMIREAEAKISASKAKAGKLPGLARVLQGLMQ